MQLSGQLPLIALPLNSVAVLRVLREAGEFPDSCPPASRTGKDSLRLECRVTDDVEVVNYTGDARGLTALAEALSIDGSVKWRKSVSLDGLTASQLDSKWTPQPD